MAEGQIGIMISLHQLRADFAQSPNFTRSALLFFLGGGAGLLVSAVDLARAWLLAAPPEAIGYAGLGFTLGILPNFFAAIGLTWFLIGFAGLLPTARPWMWNAAGAAVAIAVLTAWEVAQQTGGFLEGLVFDSMDLAATLVGVLLALAVSAWLDVRVHRWSGKVMRSSEVSSHSA